MFLNKYLYALLFCNDGVRNKCRQGCSSTALSRFFMLTLLISFCLTFGASSAQAQSVTWTATDIGGASTGTYSYSSGTYTVGGAGTGVGGASDSFRYVYSPISGNVEMTAYVSTQTNTSSYATAGLMIRGTTSANDPLDPDSAQAYISVSPKNGVNFTYRAVDGGPSTTILGPSKAVPVYVRLVRSSNSIAGYQSADGINWTLVGTYNFQSPDAMSSSFDIGFAVSSNADPTISTADFSKVTLLTSVPQRSANMALWLRSDVGVTYNGSNQVSKWIDQSGNGNHALQSTSSNQPTISTNAINGLPALSFNGTSQYLQLLSGFANFTSGASIFVVVNPTSTASDARFIELGTAANTNTISLQRYSTTAGPGFYVYSGASGSSVVSTSGLTTSQYQLVEALHNGSNVATLYTNGTQIVQGAINSIPNITRTGNIGTNYSHSGNFIQGQIAEVIVYNKILTDSERQTVESYIYGKYGIGSAPAAPTPVISPSGVSIYGSPQTVTITGLPAPAQIYYTTDGSTPTTGSTPYTAPFVVSSATTIKAIQVAPFFSQSAVATTVINIDISTDYLPRNGLQMWMRSDIGVTYDGSNKVSLWSDMSGNGYDASQSNATYKPTFVTNAINSLPALQFDGVYSNMPMTSGFANFSAGASAFAVVKPNYAAPNSTFFSIGNTYPYDALYFWEYTGLPTTVGTYTSTSSTSFAGTNLDTSGGAITYGTYQIAEFVHNGAGQGSLYVNGNLLKQGTVQNLANITRTNNCVGGLGNNIAIYNGQMTELLLYNRPLSQLERTNVEKYLNRRYFNVFNAPVVTPGSGAYSSSQTVVMTADPGASIYYTTDGTTPTTSSTLYTAPFEIDSSTEIRAIAYLSPTTSSVTNAFIEINPPSAAVSRSGLALWLKGDFGTDFTNANLWGDLSGSDNNATPSANGVFIANNAINGYPSVGTYTSPPPTPPNYLTLPSGFFDFSAGASFFIVTNPSNSGGSTGGNYLLDLGNGAASNNLTIGATGVNGRTATFTVYSGASPSSLSATDALTANQYQLLEVIHTGSSTAKILINGNQVASGSIYNVNSISRTMNHIFTNSAASSTLYAGNIAEVLVYNRAITSAEQKALEGYLAQKYQFDLNTTAPPAPTFSLAAGSLSGPSSVVMTSRTGSAIYYTTDGSTPTTSSSAYSGPVKVNYSQTVKAIAAQNGLTSGVTSAAYTLDSSRWPGPNASDSKQLNIYMQLPVSATQQ